MLTRRIADSGEPLSALGFGVMRLPSRQCPDEASSIRLLRESVHAGVTYFDTAFVYSAGRNEALLGKAMAGDYRDRVRIATKLPPTMIARLDAARRMLAMQLSRLQTDHIDYFLLHMLMDRAMFDRLAALGVLDWLEEQKRKGVVRHIGFSFHGTKEDFEALLRAYPWDLVQIQYNYLDEWSQATRDGLRLAASLGIPVVVMEPLRGGQLVENLPEEVVAAFAAARPEWTPAEWALRWLWNQPEVTVVLSGMADGAQLAENARIAAVAGPGCLTEADLAVFERVKEILLERTKVPCTACRYCMPCPYGVDIPGCFQQVNDRYRLKRRGGAAKYGQALGALSARPGFASQCTECGVCEPKCPQRILIRKELKSVAREMEGPLFRPVIGAMRFFTGAARLRKGVAGPAAHAAREEDPPHV